jgi:nitrate reductase NapAB chaperone NapD
MVENEINAIVGAWARVNPERAEEVRRSMESFSQVSAFDLDEPGKVGLLIEAGDLDQAHGLLTKKIRCLDGVWGVWPVYAHHEIDQEEKE